MKKILLTFLCTASTATALANDNCDLWLETAQSVMGARQKGLSISNLMAIVDKNNDGTVKVAINVDTIKRMIVEAYNSPLKNTDQEKKELIVEFGNKHYLICFKENES